MSGHRIRKKFHDPREFINPRYEIADDIGRTVHLDDYFKCQEQSRMIPNKIDDYSFMPEEMHNKKVLWFAPCQETYEHNWYGNVDMRINFKKILERFDYTI